MARRVRGLHAWVVDDLGRRIVGGEYSAGYTFDLLEVASNLDVSHTALREALRTLSDKGLIAARPRRGTYVQTRDHWDQLDRDVLTWRYEAGRDMELLHDLLEVRQSLEPTASSLAAVRRTREDLDELHASLDEFRSADAISELVVAADVRFHRAVFGAAHNEVLQQMGQIVEIGLRARDKVAHTREGWSTTIEQHAGVADRIFAADPQGAQEAMQVLLDRSASTLERSSEWSRDA